MQHRSNTAPRSFPSLRHDAAKIRIPWRWILAIGFAAWLSSGAAAADQPNFVWLISEDNSVHYLKLYDEGGAPTPRIAELAEHGLLFEHAFSNSPVCSVARTTLMTSCYAPRIGTQFHRKSVTVPMPPNLKMFPAYLREQGYYTSNRQKKDYNAVEGPGVWDESSGRASWRNRSSGQPFFHMQSFSTSHESKLHFPDQKQATKTDPSTVAVAPYHPDTPTFRYTNARYRDRIQEVDAQIGKVVDQLAADGLLENTFIFYFGDHGGVLPRGKGYAYESGLHVPLVVRVPQRWQQLIDGYEPNTRRRGFVSFIDFGPTLLQLASVSLPQGVDGRPFLGPQVLLSETEQRDEAFGYADRFDEKYDLVRTLRKGKYKYIRNYQPFNVDGLQNNYRYKMLAFQEWRELYHQGKLEPAQRAFFEPRTAEALYDLSQDPHEINNLAGNRDRHLRATLRALRQQLSDHTKALPDLSLYPEPMLTRHALANPVPFGTRYRNHIGVLVDVADLALLPWRQARRKILRALRSGDRWQRYWALIACTSHGKPDEELVEFARGLASSDEENLVRVRAAEYLALVAKESPTAVLEDCLSRAQSGIEGCLIMNTLVLLRDGPASYTFSRPANLPTQEPGMSEFQRRLTYLGW